MGAPEYHDLAPPVSPDLPAAGTATRVDVPAIAVQQWRAEGAHWPIGAPTAAPLTSGSSSGPAPAAPRPILAASGQVTGRLLDVNTHAAIVGANVSATALSGTVCSGCNTSVTNATGGFDIVAPSGPVELIFEAPDYLSNRTWTTTHPGSRVSVGTVYLVHDGYVRGVVESAVPGHPAIGRVAVTAASRDGSVVASPSGLTPANGTFRIPVPPLPSIVNFAYQPLGLNASPWIANWTFVNATPYATVDLGVVLLEGGVAVQVRLWDRTNASVVPAFVPTSIEVCSQRGDTCSQPVPNTFGGASVPGWAIPGPAYLKAFAVGYVLNQTPIPDIPNTNRTVDLGRVDLVELGAFEVTTNLTGGVPSVSGWAAGTQVTESDCSLEGIGIGAATGILNAGPCWSGTPHALGATTIQLGPPLRDVVVLSQGLPGVQQYPGFPTAFEPVYAISTLLPRSEWNITWVNLTPGRVVQLGSFDLTPGTYLAGNVSAPSFGTNLSGRFEVQVCSTEETSICEPAVTSADLEPSHAGCPTATFSYCAEAPPGPVEVTVTLLANATSTAATNRTWVTVARGCCAQDGHPTWLPKILVTPVAAWGAVTGVVFAQHPSGGIPDALIGAIASVEVCPAGPLPIGAEGGCSNGASDPTTGRFDVPALDGWDQVSVAVAGYQSNWTWVFVNGTNATGRIELAPVSVLAGQVVDSGGHSVYEAVVQICKVSQPQFCQSGGLSTLTASDGTFNLSIPDGGPLPQGSFEVMATASGFVSNWTWVNVSAGNLTVLRPIQLPPVGARPLAGRGAISYLGATWVAGRIVDNRTGLGVPAVSLTYCPLSGSACTFVSGTTPMAGTFNFTLPRGAYDLGINATDYVASVIFTNATGGPVDLGVVRVQPFPWLAGTSAVNPWAGLSSSVGLGAVGVQVQGCSRAGAPCGLAVPVATDGSFNVSLPFGTPSQLEFVGQALPVFGTAAGGWVSTTYAVNVTAAYGVLSGSALGVPIFGTLASDLRDGSSWNATAGFAMRPAGFATVDTYSNSAQSGYSRAWTGGGGSFELLLPPGATQTEILGYGSAYLVANLSLPGSTTTGSSATVANLTLTHFGYVEARIRDGGTGAAVAWALATVSLADPANTTTIQRSQPVAEDGFVNVTAPPGGSVGFTVAAAGYANRSLTTSVLPVRTSRLGSVNLSASAARAPAWIQSGQVNTVGHAATPTVVDPATGRPLALATVQATTPAGVTTSPSLRTNALGQFLLNLPPGSPDALLVSLPSYSAGLAFYSVMAGSRTVVNRVNLTGDGVLAGRVVIEPTGGAASNIEIDGCAADGTGCTALAYTNGGGLFWIAVHPGLALLRVTTDSYLANVTVTRDVSTDTWTWVGAIPVYALATVIGTVRALPSGLPLANATAAVCSALYAPYGPCGSSVPTAADGTFALPSPPGRFVLVFSAPFYNTSYQPIVLPPGAVVYVGTHFLVSWGSVRGSVVSAVSLTPVGTASVQACAAWNPGLCSPISTVDAAGRYLLLAPPGPDLIIASAPQYSDNQTRLTVPSGQTVDATPIELTPIAPNVPEGFSGTVVRATLPMTPIPGAFVALDFGAVPVAAGATDAQGGFALTANWGTYTLRVQAPGFLPARQTLILHAPVAGRVISLTVATYLLTGTVRDSRTNAPLVGIALSNGSSVLATTDGNGVFSVALANGTYAFTATSPAGAAEVYNPLNVDIMISGAPVAHDLFLVALGIRLLGTVVDASTGLPIAGAKVTLVSALPGASALGASAVASADGAFSVVVPIGSYLLHASATGYVDANVSVTASAGGPPLEVALQRESPPTPSGNVSLVLPVGAALGLAALAIGVLLWRRARRSPPPPPAPRWTLDDEPALDVLPVAEDEPA